MNSSVKLLFGLLAWFFIASVAHAFASREDQISHYLQLLSGSNIDAKVQMLERLQWSGLMDPALFDEIEARVMGNYQNDDISTDDFRALGYEVRALGYSGNEKYLPTLETVRKDADERKIRGYAKKAVRDMERFSALNKQVASSDFAAPDKPAEIETYMKMLSTDDADAQRMAARAIYHERQTDPDLLELTADKLRGLYLAENLSKDAQDTAAWFCKALGTVAGNQYRDLLSTVAGDTQYGKIKKYASKYVN